MLDRKELKKLEEINKLTKKERQEKSDTNIRIRFMIEWQRN